MKYLLFAALLAFLPVKGDSAFAATENPTTCAPGAQACFAKPGSPEHTAWLCGTFKDIDRCNVNSICTWRKTSCQPK